MDDSQIHRLMTQSECSGRLTPAVRRFAQACAATGSAAERERLIDFIEDDASRLTIPQQQWLASWLRSLGPNCAFTCGR